MDNGLQNMVQRRNGISFVSYAKNACDTVREQVLKAS